ncbi:hypothetical protein [Marinobacter algicola]|uniref:SMODS and SLOG-associating 2TM effector domain-containing protein n=1 Tax=Marinobacter algicola DG893 TaxID=443152 RepID=A6F383_9GAMM|nr:hypothetical protein [Marinobacter algicola]EDM46811.1 hypothetical protein MDG893_09065 [Marinobacter algicola DG893]
MPENLELELSKQFKASQERYVYFVLAASASAIGFAMTQSKTEPLNYFHAPLGLAIFLWAVSFVSGLKVVEYAVSVTFQNQNYLAFKRELHSLQAENKSELIAQFKERLDETVGKQEAKMQLYGGLQSWCLLLGGLFYIVWHGARMWALNA